MELSDEDMNSSSPSISITTTETQSSKPTKEPIVIKNKYEPIYKNSLGQTDNIEDFAPARVDESCVWDISSGHVVQDCSSGSSGSSSSSEDDSSSSSAVTYGITDRDFDIFSGMIL